MPSIGRQCVHRVEYKAALVLGSAAIIAPFLDSLGRRPPRARVSLSPPISGRPQQFCDISLRQSDAPGSLFARDTDWYSASSVAKLAMRSVAPGCSPTQQGRR